MSKSIRSFVTFMLACKYTVSYTVFMLMVAQMTLPLQLSEYDLLLRCMFHQRNPTSVMCKYFTQQPVKTCSETRLILFKGAAAPPETVAGCFILRDMPPLSIVIIIQNLYSLNLTLVSLSRYHRA